MPQETPALEPATPAEIAAGIDDPQVSLEEYLERALRIRRGDIAALRKAYERPPDAQDVDC